ncbi:MAG: acyl-ACP--UDP-N-acetylglucosamine O-acyltransferase [Myxococcales bacterium]|nr:acyl-ACP--UDP-N-acetylglucosamine O-acyltransferase [Myxococcales bacterium]
MSPFIDATARVHPAAHIHPTAVVGAHSAVGPGCRLDAYAVVGPHTTLGPGCHVHPFAVVGGPAQDRQTDPDAPFRLVCGADNTFREGVTLSRGTARGGGVTRVGDGGCFMAHSHVGHDGQIGDRVTLANGVSLGGHVELGDDVTVAGHAAIHQFARVGRLAFIAANAMISLDIPPFTLAGGDRARLLGLNRVGLQRAGVAADHLAALEAAWRRLLRTPGGRREADALVDDACPEVAALARFLVTSTRGVTAAGRAADDPG